MRGVRLHRRVTAHGELKASWLPRWCDRDDLLRLLGPDGLLPGAAVRQTDVLLGSQRVSGLDLPGEATDRATALVLRRHGEGVFGPQRWQGFLTRPPVERR